jgi:hypothetical protein
MAITDANTPRIAIAAVVIVAADDHWRHLAFRPNANPIRRHDAIAIRLGMCRRRQQRESEQECGQWAMKHAPLSSMSHDGMNRRCG